jgi:hypothetical protein
MRKWWYGAWMANYHPKSRQKDGATTFVGVRDLGEHECVGIREVPAEGQYGRRIPL